MSRVLGDIGLDKETDHPEYSGQLRSDPSTRDKSALVALNNIVVNPEELGSENELVMDKTSTGWQFPYVVTAGNYEYKFIVDGKWILDPANKLYEQNEYNTYNSVLWVDPLK